MAVAKHLTIDTPRKAMLASDPGNHKYAMACAWNFYQRQPGLPLDELQSKDPP